MLNLLVSYGWYIQGQFSTAYTPRSLHVSVNYGTIENVTAMLGDLKECVDIVKQGEQLDGEAIRDMVAQALQSPHPDDAFDQLAQMAGIVGSELPDEMALINEVLDALPDELANMLLINYLYDLYV